MPAPLILIPTSGELKVIAGRLAELGYPEDRIQPCGFGPVSSGVRTMQLLMRHSESEVILAGIAGGLQRESSPGQAVQFNDVAMYGIGAGSADTFRTAGNLGWAHWREAEGDGSEVRIGDRISLKGDTQSSEDRQLLTVCSAAATLKDVHDRLSVFPDAIAEDMEGFSVAFACTMARVPLSIFRGISNVAGDRDKSHWRTRDALHAVADLLIEHLK